MLATVHDDTWHVLYITPNSKRLDYADIPALKKIKGPTYNVESGHHIINNG